MKLATFVPSNIIKKEGSVNVRDATFREKYEHYQSIAENYKKVEEFLDAPIHKKDAESDKWRKIRNDAVSRIVAIGEMEYNQMSENIQWQLEGNWQKRSGSNREIDKIMEDLTGNHLFYRRIRRVVKRIRHVRKRIKEQGPIARILSNSLDFADVNLLNLYQLNLNNRHEVNDQLTKLDILTHGVKRLSLVTGQFSRYYGEWMKGDAPESVHLKREDRLKSILLKIESIQMESLFTETDLENLIRYMEILRELPSWDPRAELGRKIILSEERHLKYLNPTTSVDLSNQFRNPVEQFLMANELILYNDDRIISEISPVENREALARFVGNPNQEDDVTQFLFQHREGLANCSIHVSEEGHYYLCATHDIERGESLRSSMTGNAFLKWLGRGEAVPEKRSTLILGLEEMDERTRIRTKIADLEKEAYRYNADDLERIDLSARIKFLTLLIKSLPQKKVTLSDTFSL